MEATEPTSGTTKYEYNLASHLFKVFWRPASKDPWSAYVTRMEYSADNQVTRTDYGNGTRTMYNYDSRMRYLISKKTQRSSRTVLEYLIYSYDCMKRTTHICDKSQQDVYFCNHRIPPDRDFYYDAVGQLVKACGREQIDARNGSRYLKSYTASSFVSINQTPGDGYSMCRYIEDYSYDIAGNLLGMIHQASDDALVAGWTRQYF